MQKFYFALFFAVSLVVQASSANHLHKFLKAEDFNLLDFVNYIEELDDPKETLSELDEDELTVFGRAIFEHRQDAVEFLLFHGFDDVGPKGKGQTLTEFSMQTHSPDIYVFLSNYETARKSYSIGTSINVAHVELEKFHAKVENPAVKPFRWPPLYGNEPEILRNLNYVMGEACRLISRSADDL